MSATGYNRKHNRTSTKGGCVVGPTRSVLLRETPVEDLADASKTALIFVVVLDAFYMACMGRQINSGGFSRSGMGTASACFKSRYSCMTVLNSWKQPLWFQERSRERNLFTACDLDSPICLELGSFSRGTMKRPSLKREWLHSK